VRVLLPQCGLAAFAPAPDSSLAVLGVLEDVDASGRATKLSVWSVSWQDGNRLLQTVLPVPCVTSSYHDTWARWMDRGKLLWADAAGALAHLDVTVEKATALLAAPVGPPRTRLHRVVALATPDRNAADSMLKKLRTAGVEAGVFQGETFEVQAGAFLQRADADARVAALRRQGIEAAEVRMGGADSIAAGIPFATIAGPGARSASVRNVERAGGLFSEIWITPANAPARRLVASFDALGPQAPQP
jgi:hypothetical protein